MRFTINDLLAVLDESANLYRICKDTGECISITKEKIQRHKCGGRLFIKTMIVHENDVYITTEGARNERYD